MHHFAGYHQLSLLAEGRDRVIYSGQSETGQAVVLKALRSEHPSADMIALMYHEYAIGKELKELPGVIQTYDIYEKNNQYALIQEDMHGISLSQYIQKNPVTDLGVFFSLAIQMAKTLEALHRHHIIHKDIKPSNFIIQPETLVIKLTDFNYSTQLMHEVQEVVPPNKLEGTLAYMAPEQTGRMNRNIDYRSDFYALGVSYYELISGALPFSFSDPLELIHAHLANPVPKITRARVSIPPVVMGIIEKLMAKNPGERYQSTVGLLADLERCEHGLKTQGEVVSFPLGEQDLFDRLNLSQRLYGREAEAKTLLSVYQNVSRGSVESMMVCGYSGIGKTMLIHEVHQAMVRDKGYFISGKFDQLQRNTPYTAMTQALNQLARLIIAEPEARYSQIKSDLLHALEGTGQLIIDIAPDFELVLGPQPELKLLEPQETENRMMYFFKRFLRAMAQADHPLVLFIDDLQWIDSGTLKLFEYVLTDTALTHVFLIGAYRDNEVDEHHPLRRFFNEMEALNKTIHRIVLEPLSSADFTAFFADSFNRTPQDVSALAELVHKRTDGNPFFCKQLVGTVYRDNLLYFDYPNRQWAWDLEAIHGLKITANVIDLMLDKLKVLPDETQMLLRYAACIGSRFTIKTLMLITGKSADELGVILWSALHEELIVTLRLGHKRLDAMRHEQLSSYLAQDIVFQFIHDRVQQVVYQGFSTDEKQQAHLKIGRLLMGDDKPQAIQKERLFEVVDHFNEAQALLDNAEQLLLVELNYKAAIQAQHANAYQPMQNYLLAALALMDESWWETHYEWAFKVNREYAQSLYLTKDFEPFFAAADQLLVKAKTDIEKFSMHKMLMLGYSAVGLKDKSLEQCFHAFGLLGIQLDNHPNQWKILLGVFLLDLKIRFMGMNHWMQRLSKKSVSTNSDRTTIRTLFSLGVQLTPKGQTYLVYVYLKIFQYLIESGDLKILDSTMVVYGHIRLLLFNDTKGYFKCLEISNNSNIDDALFESGMGSALGYYHYLRYPYEAADMYFQKTLELSLKAGDLVTYAYTSVIVLVDQPLVKVKSLRQVIEGCIYCIKLNSELKNQKAIEYFSDLSHLFTALEQPECYQSVKGVFASYHPGNKINLTKLRYMAFYAYFIGDYKSTVTYYKNWVRKGGLSRFVRLAIETDALAGLAFAQLIPHQNWRTRWSYTHCFSRLLKKLKKRAKDSPDNFQHLFLMLQGEQARLRGRMIVALDYFNQAIDHAKSQDMYLWVAVANELAVNLLMSYKQGHRCAIDYIYDAHYYYKRYGMGVKVAALEALYPECFKAREQREYDGGSRDTSSNNSSAKLDFMSVLKASQAISGEIVLDRLFEKMLHVALENAGAEKGLFLEAVKNEWRVVARLEHQDEEETFAIMDEVLAQYDQVPQMVIQFALRSKEAVVLENASEDSQYRQDPYIQRTAAKSVLCLPVVHHDVVIGVIYLENNLAVGTFTQDRVTVLTTLASQIAISLENARHLDQMQQVYAKTERFVPKRFLQIIGKENIEEVSLGDCARREISVLFNDIRSFTTLVEKRTPEDSFEFVNRYWKFMAPIIRTHGGYIDQYQGDAILAVFANRPEDCMRAAVAMMNALSDFNEFQLELGDLAVNIGIGISTGPAILGVIGEEERQVSGLISDVANTAARVEGLNKLYGSRILFSDATSRGLPADIEIPRRMVDVVRLKGKELITEIYEAIEWQGKLKDITLAEYLEHFNRAFAAYKDNNFQQAQLLFARCLELHPQDMAAQNLHDRCLTFVQSGVPGDWDGAFYLTSK